jgi:hypothetical protein
VPWKSRLEEGVAATPAGQAGAIPILGPCEQLGPQRIAFDVTEYGGQMVVVLDQEGLEKGPARPCPVVT